MVRWTLKSGAPRVAGPGVRGAVRGAGFLGRVRGGRTGDAQGVGAHAHTPGAGRAAAARERGGAAAPATSETHWGAMQGTEDGSFRAGARRGGRTPA